MSTFLDTRGKSNIAIGYCDRCGMKMANADMVADGDKPGLFVHKDCSDGLDPWKLPPRAPDEVTVPHPRGDGFVGSSAAALIPDDTN